MVAQSWGALLLPRNTDIVDGDSIYNRRHGQGYFNDGSFPCGTLVDFMPKNDMKLEPIGSKAIQGVFLGYRVHAGGLWSGDYIVADYTPLKKRFVT